MRWLRKDGLKEDELSKNAGKKRNGGGFSEQLLLLVTNTLMGQLIGYSKPDQCRLHDSVKQMVFQRASLGDGDLRQLTHCPTVKTALS